MTLLFQDIYGTIKEGLTQLKHVHDSDCHSQTTSWPSAELPRATQSPEGFKEAHDIGFEPILKECNSSQPFKLYKLNIPVENPATNRLRALFISVDVTLILCEHRNKEKWAL